MGYISTKYGNNYNVGIRPDRCDKKTKNTVDIDGFVYQIDSLGDIRRSITSLTGSNTAKLRTI